MTPAEVITFLRQFNERCRDCQFEDKYRVMEAVDAAVEMIERMEKMEAALRIAVRQNSHDMLMTGSQLRQCEAALEESK